MSRISNDPALTPAQDEAALSSITDPAQHAGRGEQTYNEKDGEASRAAPTSAERYITSRASGIKNRVKRFTPSWFAVVMGTGICNTLLFDLPWASTHDAFRGIGAGFLILGILICILFTAITLARFIIWPEIIPVLISHELHSLFLGCIPMGYVTLISGIGVVGASYDIPNAIEVGAGLYWLAFAMSLLSVSVVPFAMFTKHNAGMEGLSALWLLPVVPPITVGAAGAVFADLLTPINPHYALTILLTGYVMNGIGLLLAIFIMVLYFQRLAIHHLPPREIIVSSLLPLGPCGQGGFALVRGGQVAQSLFPILAAQFPDRPAYVALLSVGSPMYGAGIVLGLLLWGLGIWWAFVAAASISTVFIDGVHLQIGAFSMGFWSSTFPIGSLALLTLALGETFDSMFFNVVGTIMTVIVIAMWALCFGPTFKGFVRGSLFSAPCLTRLPSESGSSTPLKPPGESRAQSRERLASPNR